MRDYDGRVLHRPFTDPRDASEFRAFVIRRRERFHAGLELIPEKITFGEWVKRWLKKRKEKRPEATWSPEVARLNRTWLPRFKDRLLTQIHPADIEEILGKITASGRSPATRNRHRAMLHRIFSEAMRTHPPLVLSNPVKATEALPEDWRKRSRVVLTEIQLERYCRAAKRISRSWYRVAEVLCWSGMRGSEVLALRWQDFAEDGITVRRILCKTTGEIFERTKSQRANGGFTAMLLDRVRKLVPKNAKPTDLVCGGMPHWLAHRLHKRTLRLAGLPKITLKGLRHSFGRAMKRRGLTRDDIRDALGHESAFTTERYTRTEDIDHVHRRALRSGFGTKPSKRRRV